MSDQGQADAGLPILVPPIDRARDELGRQVDELRERVAAAKRRAAYSLAAAAIVLYLVFRK